MTARLALVLAVLAGCTIPAVAAPTQTAPVSGQPILGAILDEIPIDATHPPIDDPELRRRVVMNLDDAPPHGIPRPTQ